MLNLMLILNPWLWSEFPWQWSQVIWVVILSWQVFPVKKFSIVTIYAKFWTYVPVMYFARNLVWIQNNWAFEVKPHFYAFCIIKTEPFLSRKIHSLLSLYKRLTNKVNFCFFAVQKVRFFIYPSKMNFNSTEFAFSFFLTHRHWLSKRKITQKLGNPGQNYTEDSSKRDLGSIKN